MGRSFRDCFSMFMFQRAHLLHSVASITRIEDIFA